MPEIQAGAEADFQDLAANIGKRAFPKLSEFWRAHRPVAEPWKDETGVKAHWSAFSVNPRPSVMSWLHLGTFPKSNFGMVQL